MSLEENELVRERLDAFRKRIEALYYLKVAWTALKATTDLLKEIGDLMYELDLQIQEPAMGSNTQATNTLIDLLGHLRERQQTFTKIQAEQDTEYAQAKTTYSSRVAEHHSVTVRTAPDLSVESVDSLRAFEAWALGLIKTARPPKMRGIFVITETEEDGPQGPTTVDDEFAEKAAGFVEGFRLEEFVDMLRELLEGPQ